MSEPVSGWGTPPFPRTLADDDPLLTPTERILTPERELLRQQIVDSHLAGTSPVTGRKPIMYLMGGGGASGKGAVKDRLVERGEIATANVVNLDPDEIKASFPEYDQIIAAGDSRAAATVHEESSAVSKRVLAAAMDGRRDIAYDVTMGNPAKGNALIDRAKDAGYEVRLYGVTVDPVTAVHRNAGRAARTGRYVPVGSQLEAHKGFSQGFESYAHRADRAQLYDTNGTSMLIAEKPAGGELRLYHPNEYAAFQHKAELDPEASGPDELYPRAGEQHLFSRGGSRTNQEIVDSGEGLPRTRETVDEAAGAAGVELTDVEVVMIDEPDEIRYLDHQQAYAYTPAELGGAQVRLGPASFADRETLVATLAHEKTHVEQLRAGADLDTETVKDLEVEAYASEASALERLKEHDSNQVHGRDHVRPAEPGRDLGAGDAGERGDPGRDDAGGGGDEVAGADSGGGVPDAGERGDEQGDVADRAGGRDADRAGDDPDQSGLTDSAKTEEQVRLEEEPALGEEPNLESDSKTEPGADDGLEDENDGTQADATARVDAQEESERQAEDEADRDDESTAHAEDEAAAQAEDEAAAQAEDDAATQAEDEAAAQRGEDEQAAAEADDAQVDNQADQEATRTEAEAEEESAPAESQAQSEEQADRQGEAGSETEAGGADADDEPSRTADRQADSEAGADGAEAGAQAEAGDKADAETDAGADAGSAGADAQTDSGADAEVESGAEPQAESGADAQAERGGDAQAEGSGGGYEEQAAADDARVAGAMESEDSGGDYEGEDYSYEDISAGDDMGRE